jgi:hypothetical protein
MGRRWRSLCFRSRFGNQSLREHFWPLLLRMFTPQHVQYRFAFRSGSDCYCETGKVVTLNYAQHLEFEAAIRAFCA